MAKKRQVAIDESNLLGITIELHWDRPYSRGTKWIDAVDTTRFILNHEMTVKELCAKIRKEDDVAANALAELFDILKNTMKGWKDTVDDKVLTTRFWYAVDEFFGGAVCFDYKVKQRKKKIAPSPDYFDNQKEYFEWMKTEKRMFKQENPVADFYNYKQTHLGTLKLFVGEQATVVIGN